MENRTLPTSLYGKIESILAVYAESTGASVSCAETLAPAAGRARWIATFFSGPLDCYIVEYAPDRQNAIERLFRKILESVASLEEMLISAELAG